MTMLKSIVEWAVNDLPPWQSDAVRRLLTQERLSEQDKLEILSILKKKHDLIDPQHPAPEPQPLKKGHISGVPQIASSIILKLIRIERNVNAIPDGSELPLGHAGLTVIYGENASGKSGYARVLKRACNARDTKECVLPNAFKSTNPGPAKAIFKVSINGGTDQDIPWTDGQESDPVLANICVFDSKCARVIVDENNDISYLPYGATVFEDLVTLFQDLRGRLESEKPKPKNLEYPDISSITKAGKILTNLTYMTPYAQIEKSAQWTNQQEQHLIEINQRIADADAHNSKQQALRIRHIKSRIIRFLDIVLTIESVLSEPKADSLREAVMNLIAAEKALDIASQESLVEEPLPGAGTDVWQKLYYAAKSYSLQRAYPDQDFPFVGTDSKCVLCMQPIEEEAKGRMLRFKEFMEKKTKKAVEDAIEKVESIKKSIEGIEIPKSDEYHDIIEEISIRVPNLKDQLISYFPIANSRAEAMISFIIDKNELPLPKLNEFSLECPAQIAGDLEFEAKQIEKTADPEALASLKAARSELSATKLFKQRLPEILRYIEQLKIIQKYNSCIADTNFTSITVQGKTMLAESLTPRLQVALRDELIDLDINHLPLNLRAIGVKGETLHKMELVGCQYPKTVNISDILSEGEQHVVAIAGFLAELRVANSQSPIVFDDPVCSLDHLYREKIAERLIKEAKFRQVLVFTHDIAFLLELKAKAGEEQGIYFLAQTVRKNANSPGQCMDGLPWHAMNVRDRIIYVQSQLDEHKGLYKNDPPKYNRVAGYLYGLLREAWEAAVEEILFQRAVVRHSGEVQTLRLITVSVTDDDYRIIYWAMKKCSKWLFGHDKSDSTDVNRPAPDELNQDIASLREFVRTINSRCEGIRRQRLPLLEPAMPSIG